jgi:hypothetical protein
MPENKTYEEIQEILKNYQDKELKKREAQKMAVNKYRKSEKGILKRREAQKAYYRRKKEKKLLEILEKNLLEK